MRCIGERFTWFSFLMTTWTWACQRQGNGVPNVINHWPANSHWRNSQVQTPIAHSNLVTMYQMFNLHIVVVLVKFQQARWARWFLTTTPWLPRNTTEMGKVTSQAALTSIPCRRVRTLLALPSSKHGESTTMHQCKQEVFLQDAVIRGKYAVF